MDAELPAYLLERKLRNLNTLLGDDKSSCSGPRDKISRAIDILEQIGESSRIANSVHLGNLLPENVNGILESIQILDNLTDMFLLRRASVEYLAWRSNTGLARGLAKFEKRITQIFPAAASTKLMNSPQEALLHRQPPINWTSIRRQPHKLMSSVQAEPRRKMFQELVSMRADTRGTKKLPILALEGWRGAGKTTIVRNLYDSVEVIKLYECRAWVSVHENLSYKDVLLELIEQIGKNGVVLDHMKEEAKLVVELFKLLSSFKCFLIVLDDCTQKIWPRLMECLPADKSNKTRVVITTPTPLKKFIRNPGNFDTDVADFVSVTEMTKVSDRKEFLSHLVKEEGILRAAEQLMDHVSVGSTRAAVTVAGALNTQRQDHIQRAIETLISYIRRAPNQKLSARVALKWSYHDLHPLIKACFLFLSIFPKGIEVPLRRVQYLWLSEGFLDDDVTSWDLAPSGTSQRNLARICFGILINRKLIEITKWKLDGSPKSCRLPLFIHDFATNTLKSTRLFNVYSHSDSEDGAWDDNGSRVLRLASHAECEIPRTCMHQHLRAYVSFHTKTGGKLNKEIELHLKMLLDKHRYVLLKLLDLEGVYKPNLPDSIGNLQYLRYLGLRSTLLDSLPSSIAKLLCLETMDLKHTNVMNLPSSLVRSKKLRHLHTKEVPLDAFIAEPCRHHCLPCACPKWQQHPSNLETLTGLYVGGGSSNVSTSGRQLFENLRELEVTCNDRNPSTPAESRTSEASSTVIGNLISGMADLQSLKLNSTDTSRYYPLNFSRHNNLEKIYLCCKLEPGGAHAHAQQGTECPPHPLTRRLPRGLRELTLSMSELAMDPMKVLGELDCLVVLRLLARSYIGDEMKCERFPSLRVLKLWKLPQLVSLTIQCGSMPRLEEMEIRQCPMMRKFVGSDVLVKGKINFLALYDMHEEFLNHVRGQGIIQKTTIVRPYMRTDDQFP